MSKLFKLCAVLLCMFTTLCFGKVYDCFMFFNEYEVLDIRFHELYDHVDKFVIVESCEGFTGISKPFNFEENQERYAKFLDKVIYVKLYNRIDTDSPWDREFFQRNQIMQGLVNCESDDAIFISDCDEIPEGSILFEAVEDLKSHKVIGFKPIMWSIYCLNRAIHSPNCPDAGYAKDLEKLDQFMKDSSQRGLGICGHTAAIKYKDLLPFSPQEIRENVRCYQPDGTQSNSPYSITCYKASGWHFASMGGSERAYQKYKNWAHVGDCIGDYSEIKDGSEEYKYIQWRQKADGISLEIIDETYPQYVRDNIDYFLDIGLVDPY